MDAIVTLEPLMCVPKNLAPLVRQVTATQASYTTVFTTPWMIAAGADTLRTMLDLRQLAGALGAKICWRTAAVRTDLPDAWQYGTARTTADSFVEDIDLTSTTNKLWIQLGLATAASSGVAEALATLKGSLLTHGVLIGTRTVEILPTVNTSQTAYVPVGEPFPAVGLSKMLFGIVVSGVAGTLNYGVSWRGMDFDVERPDAWSAFTSGDSWSGITTDELNNTGLLSASFGSPGMIQAGLKWSGTSAQATIRVTCVAVY